MNLIKLQKILGENGCQKVYVKALSPNDNSKNQVYFARGSWELLNIFPISDIKNESPGKWEKERFKASISFYWIDNSGHLSHAPKSQLILYPKYPEIRFSGFLDQCENAPSELMTSRLEKRVLFLSITSKGHILGYVASPNSEIATEFNNLKTEEKIGVFKVFNLPQAANSRGKLLDELYRIHLLNWINSKRLDKTGQTLPCNASNCGGYTLEAELGIIPNGYSEPDFLGWEVKQFGVKKFTLLKSSVITLMTPEPTSGFYISNGIEAFLRNYGYNDTKGRSDRVNFGGIHKVGMKCKKTSLVLELVGFDKEERKIKNTDGKIVLLDANDNEAASWSFSSLLLHWNRKHNQACYVPSLTDKDNGRKYKYGKSVVLGTGTDFQYFLSLMSTGHVYYDPGIKGESFSIKPQIKKRSQFRIKSRDLKSLYNTFEVVELL
jgi:hypothetical protein